MYFDLKINTKVIIFKIYVEKKNMIIGACIYKQ
jgi:hypothetical protein